MEEGTERSIASFTEKKRLVRPFSAEVVSGDVDVSADNRSDEALCYHHPRMPQFQAILFDLDGTLVDSIPFWIEANLRALEPLNVRMDADAFLKNFYHAGLHYEGILEKCAVSTEQNERFYRDRDDRFDDLLRKKVEWIGKAEKTLQHCKAHALLGMMTGSKRRFINAMDARLHLSSLFTAIVTRDDTGIKMKPDPYGLLLLAKQIGIAPQDCLYVGDQHVDVQAAKNAKMSVCLLERTETPEGAAKGADFVIRKIEGLVGVVGG